MQKDDRERFTLRLPPRLYNLLQIQAKETGVSLNALILEILWDWEKQQNQP